MKILLVNKFYYPRGGDCIYTLELEKLLTEKNHEVAVFAMQHPENLPSKYSQFFPSEAVFLLSNKKRIIETILRPFGTLEVKSKFNSLLDHFKPEVVHLNNVHTQISPIIAKLAHKRKIPVVWTLHDYKLLCPASAFLENNGSICDTCLKSPTDVFKKACIKGSKFASLIGYFEAKMWNRKKLQLYANAFIAPSKFMKHKMEQGGYASKKIVQLYNFANNDKFTDQIIKERNNEVVYVGRISIEKGVETLCKSFEKIKDARLIIIGDGPLRKELEQKYASDNIRFMGFQSWQVIKEKLSKSAFLIIPSQWYENNPLTIIEALALGTPVLGANIGGIPELIEEKVNGMVFNSRHVRDLEKQIQAMLVYKKWDYQRIQSDAKENFSGSNYYITLIKLYNQVLSDGNIK
jgi:glycosyltransferase involved in cell wall biosynthesis